ncbi:uncharacterized protein LOC130257926 isoform X2 [Oenanthe melanoleuca]|uniref:uncharacterized protein LOC130257926 isoform X2 n=1 Tax=Oenanthe melanoleuca TaxID=2939378 RepID=UPI0024C1E654|nr:uncharacterized protein LOC130257926 isoform X2 [Oenanthe melanoleuca]
MAGETALRERPGTCQRRSSALPWLSAQCHQSTLQILSSADTLDAQEQRIYQLQTKQRRGRQTWSRNAARAAAQPGPGGQPPATEGSLEQLVPGEDSAVW